MAIVGAVAFSEFFVLTLYLQDVLHYSAVQSGVAFAGFALSVVVDLERRPGGRRPRRRSPDADRRAARVGRCRSRWLTRLPLDGHYFWDLFPAFVLGGAGMGLSFVPITIASLTGVERADAGVASGLVNTSRQIGGALGIAAVSAIAATSTSELRGRARRRSRPRAPPALDHGFQTALYVPDRTAARRRGDRAHAREADVRRRARSSVPARVPRRSRSTRPPDRSHTAWRPALDRHARLAGRPSPSR